MAARAGYSIRASPTASGYLKVVVIIRVITTSSVFVSNSYIGYQRRLGGRYCYYKLHTAIENLESVVANAGQNVHEHATISVEDGS